ncbi:hypothetical protein [Pseudomonas fragariae (ex Marin et al. 2024)]|uniref:hypothetical protein n=1 Tax=Pseudomonas fragariae (ex Marin et al. 2024) TaxID=3080056 RepID=UPI003F78C9F1
MKNIFSKIAQSAIYTLGAVVCAVCLWLLVRFFLYGDNHPINVVLGVFGLAPVMPNVADMGWFDGLPTMIVSCATAVGTYLIVASWTLVVTTKVSAVISAGGYKKYRSLKIDRQGHEQES